MTWFVSKTGIPVGLFAAGCFGLRCRRFLAFWLVAVAAWGGWLPATVADPPNVVFIYIDDLGYSDVGFMGARHYRTPHIDRLAEQGMIFTSAYAAAPNCAPSRACLMSGQYSPRHGVYTVGNPDRGKAALRKLIAIKNNTVLPASVTTIGELFQGAGYQTGYFGKWHLGKPGTTGPVEQGFAVNVGGNHSGSPQGGHFSPFRNPQLPDSGEREYLTDRLTREATGFIEAKRDQPFFLMLSHYAVHTPIQAKKEITQKYQDDAGQKSFNAKYAAMIESVDDSVGQVVQKLESEKLLDQTMIIFYSDNGGHGKMTRCAPLRGSKGMAYEGGIRVPLSITWRGRITEKSRCDTPVTGVDFFETFRVMLDAERPNGQPLDGCDIMPLLVGASPEFARKSLFWHFPAYLEGKNYRGAPDPAFRARPFGAIRSGDWKLIRFFEDERVELYNLADDIGESRNLATEQPQIASRLAQDLKSWQLSVNAPIPTERNPAFKSR